MELLTYKRWYHGSRPLRYFLFVTFRPRTTTLTGPRHVHELMFSKLPCFSVAFNGRHLAWIIVYVSHTSTVRSKPAFGADGEAVLARG